MRSYTNESIKDKSILLNCLEGGDTSKDNDSLNINKKDLFLNMLFLSNEELKDSLSNCDISLDGTIDSKGSILKFLVGTEEEKINPRHILSSDIPQ